jgi:hypothetical protein
LSFVGWLVVCLFVWCSRSVSLRSHVQARASLPVHQGADRAPGHCAGDLGPLLHARLVKRAKFVSQGHCWCAFWLNLFLELFSIRRDQD